MSAKPANRSAPAATILLKPVKRRNLLKTVEKPDKNGAQRFRAVKINGRWCGNPSVRVDRLAIVESIRQDREG